MMLSFREAPCRRGPLKGELGLFKSRLDNVTLFCEPIDLRGAFDRWPLDLPQYCFYYVVVEVCYPA